MSGQEGSTTAMTFSACDEKTDFSTMPRETAGEVSSLYVQVRYTVGMMRRARRAEVQWNLPLLCAVLVESGNGL